MPSDGEAFFSSAITLKASHERAAGKSRGGAPFSTAILRATSGSTRLRCAMDSRRASTIRSRMFFACDTVSICTNVFLTPAAVGDSEVRSEKRLNYAIRGAKRCQFAAMRIRDEELEKQWKRSNN